MGVRARGPCLRARASARCLKASSWGRCRSPLATVHASWAPELTFIHLELFHKPPTMCRLCDRHPEENKMNPIGLHTLIHIKINQNQNKRPLELRDETFMKVMRRSRWGSEDGPKRRGGTCCQGSGGICKGPPAPGLSQPFLSSPRSSHQELAVDPKPGA